MNTRILIAGIGNIFLGDDGFGVEVARRLALRPLPDSVQVVDFGIQGMALAYALLDDYDALIIVDAATRQETPGTLSLIQHTWRQTESAAIEAHSMDPVKVLRLAAQLGAKPITTWIVACEPEVILSGNGDDDIVVSLSDPVRIAVDDAVSLVESLVYRTLREREEGGVLVCDR